MVDVDIPDDILHNILARIPGKPLLRFRCVSTHWNHLISDPCFMKSRSRRMIILKYPQPLVVIDTNVPVDDKAHSMVKVPSFLEYTNVSIVGTFSGIVILVFVDTLLVSKMVLYNPLTRVSKTLVVMDPPSSIYKPPYKFGFDTDDLKIVRFVICEHSPRPRYKCDVFDLKTSSWSQSPRYLRRDFFFWGDGGVFFNGCLYWVISLLNMGILALNVKEMEFSKITLPHGFDTRTIIDRPEINDYLGILVGFLNGCLCLITKSDTVTFDVWAMKKQGIGNLWSKMFSFTFHLEGNRFGQFHPMRILGDGKILLTNGSNQLLVYDTLNGSYKMLDDLASLDDYEKRDMPYYRYRIRPVEYVESWVSPLDICYAGI